MGLLLENPIENSKNPSKKKNKTMRTAWEFQFVHSKRGNSDSQELES